MTESDGRQRLLAIARLTRGQVAPLIMELRTQVPPQLAMTPMKIGTLLTAAIVSLSTVGGGFAVYVAVTKYQTMDNVSVAQSRLQLVRAVAGIPSYLNSERGFATNILYG